jgi:hypothetical protein
MLSDVSLLGMDQQRIPSQLKGIKILDIQHSQSSELDNMSKTISYIAQIKFPGNDYHRIISTLSDNTYTCYLHTKDDDAYIVTDKKDCHDIFMFLKNYHQALIIEEFRELLDIGGVEWHFALQHMDKGEGTLYARFMKQFLTPLPLDSKGQLSTYLNDANEFEKDLKALEVQQNEFLTYCQPDHTKP